jgi:hypothetical protein
VRKADVDILASHEAVLGWQPSALIQQGRHRVDFDSACNHLVEDILAGDGRVLMTLNGLVGDSGMYSPSYILTSANAATRQRMVESEESYRLASRSREIGRQTLRPTVCHGGPFMAGCFAADNSALIPPFFPAGRNEDGALGYLIGHCLRGCYFGYLPWSLVHDPPRGRAYPPIGAPPPVRLSDIVTACVSTWGGLGRPADAATRLRSLGRHLSELALVADDFRELVRITLWRHASQRIGDNEALLRRFQGKPDCWASDVKRGIDGITATLAAPGFPACPDVSWTMEDARILVRRYGELLLWWPDIVERAAAERRR